MNNSEVDFATLLHLGYSNKIEDQGKVPAEEKLLVSVNAYKLMDQAQQDSAISSLENLADLPDKDPQATSFLVVITQQTKRQRTYGSISDLLYLDPTNYVLLNALGNKTSNPDIARSALGMAIHAEADNSIVARYWADVGDAILGKEHDFTLSKKAIDCYDKATTLDVTCSNAYVGKALAYIDMGKEHDNKDNYKRAIATLENTFKHAEDHIALAILHHTYAVALVHLNQRDEAMDHLNEAIELNPEESHHSHVLLGSLYLKKYEDSSHEKGISKTPDYSYRDQAQQHFYAAIQVFDGFWHKHRDYDAQDYVTAARLQSEMLSLSPLSNLSRVMAKRQDHHMHAALEAVRQEHR